MLYLADSKLFNKNIYGKKKNRFGRNGQPPQKITLSQNQEAIGNKENQTRGSGKEKKAQIT
ncbi:MAG: hypothetical protein A2651_00030 [Candidatus Yanofskybacteria bacterium RIFCSPHIGHO2_01_FULL_42_12]|uniref:Uncharacterized protein n=1 Tax=Candidatus Yanofskybacteria bacterium RIFCSPLOWO2_01_FULL_42_49 TaxID=1802694 RepID=A0A1F8GE37_9BACT|nr:MAG: hypothetical protein A2651_00030 [Candidatus Yanofskybacteria bacterium RIFCSPHIGHO2_01_FULL_42_12]OGN22998.1 MAG: hypothetical protein A2918_02600 [Candidatus Yanofskybacteria bacterium RIFCSPLOWO2_01_FULL_42_49]